MSRVPALIAIGLLFSAACSVLVAQQVPVQEYMLPNGMKLLMVPRKGDPNVAAGWVAKVGSANERPGITGVSHLFEHMMFKGTLNVGTRDIQADLKLIEEMDAVSGELDRERQSLARRYRLGEIQDLNDPAYRTARHKELLQKLDELQKRQKELIIPNEFDKIYTIAGASGMNAGTTSDFTVYFINVPANKLELWFWMESDRLMNPVFREFHAEKEVVKEERRLQVESTPTGKFEEEFDAMFWTSSPYGWPTIGWPSDLDGLTRAEALAYFAINYSPNNVTACLVGDFEPARARELADLYFGRIRRNPAEPLPVRTREVGQMAEKRMIAFAETNPQVEIRYHTVADGHRDDYPLTVLGTLLDGRTGRLYKSLVLDQKAANSVAAGHNAQKWEGYFTLQGVARQGVAPEQVEQALYGEIEKLQKEKVGERELQKVKNRFAADNFRRLQSNYFLMLQLLLADNSRGWQSFNDDPRKIDAVTAEDILRVANGYFKPENRTVLLYYTKKQEVTDEDPLLAGLNDQEKNQVRQFRAQLAQVQVEQAKLLLQNLESQEASVPAEKKKLFEVLKKLVQERLKNEGGAR
jgi:predicted Zn-dependent peptidase